VEPRAGANAPHRLEDRGGTWYVSYYHNGKQSAWKSTGTINKTEAEVWAIEHNPAAVAHVDKIRFAAFAVGFEPGHEWVQAASGAGSYPQSLWSLPDISRAGVF
jgi:hypothetical protein